MGYSPTNKVPIYVDITEIYFMAKKCVYSLQNQQKNEEHRENLKNENIPRDILCDRVGYLYMYLCIYHNNI
jgi:hypothetical protein